MEGTDDGAVPGRDPPFRIGPAQGGMDSMPRITVLSLGALLALAAPGWAGGLPCLGCPGPDCRPIPCPTCPDCSCPCDRPVSLTLFRCSPPPAPIDEPHPRARSYRIKAATK